MPMETNVLVRVEDLPDMTNKQAVFNHVRAHLLRQGRKSMTAGEGCAYRGDNSAMCAVGCLIPDSDYNARHEGAPASAMGLVESNRMAEFLDDLQHVHDHCSHNEWGSALHRLAERHHLEVTHE